MSRVVTSPREARRDFVWGPVLAVHEVGDYLLVEFETTRPANIDAEGWTAEVRFHPYVRAPKGRAAQGEAGGYRDTGHSFHTLDEALAHCLAFKYEWKNHDFNAALNTRADRYFLRMIGVE